MARITAIGGIFIKSPNPKALAAWYRDTLGFVLEDWGGALLKLSADSPPHSVWSPFDEGTHYFEPSKRDVMIDFAVDDLVAFLKQIEAKGVKVVGKMETDPNGLFAWIVDPDGTKIELWQPKR
jgi:predicted enzyme related to lactoylglutathione lyase